MLTKTVSSGTVHELPDDMRQAILINNRLRDMWEAITALARNEWNAGLLALLDPKHGQNTLS